MSSWAICQSRPPRDAFTRTTSPGRITDFSQAAAVALLPLPPRWRVASVLVAAKDDEVAACPTVDGELLGHGGDEWGVVEPPRQIFDLGGLGGRGDAEVGRQARDPA